MKVDVLGLDGKVVGKVELSENILKEKIREDLIKRAFLSTMMFSLD